MDIIIIEQLDKFDGYYSNKKYFEGKEMKKHKDKKFRFIKKEDIDNLPEIYSNEIGFQFYEAGSFAVSPISERRATNE